ncbi:hypothetical protein A2372_03735 [Candidatus Wolfebacteria bacterium RIFOXYB1_FULL_54_12]|uniref:Glycosyltransferase RgtA/B/C/D-like domain-containing protein n=1 Tax=Candidatus Wolfebacteria bacterium RIFOXYB1_FULL_54_12 TaxID=1802559 RepID=A0A1F8DWI0_9BACT|nr:MAG: hypothetical protein A2372_03735 [Candidatus Wolfebacteria bacterium RIFOXYB1_FULL_54_12]
MNKYKYILIFIGFAILIMWKALLPGYVLGLDMVFAPQMDVSPNLDGFLNSLPINYVIYWLGLIVPAWAVQKIIFLALFSSIGYMAFKHLPLGEDKVARLFSALIYLVNPFVYSRFLAGQWAHLMAYAFLPLFVHCLLVFKEKNDLKSGLKLFGSLFLISIFSIHFFAMASMLLVAWLPYCLMGKLVDSDWDKVKPLVRNIAICGGLFLIISSYWLIPAMDRTEPIEQRFDAAHWQAFSAGGYKNISPTLNLVSLNGFWGERYVWAEHFAWPQDYAVFWITLAFILSLVLIGLVTGIKNERTRNISIFFGILGMLSLAFASGAGETMFKDLNLWLYTHISFWSGFRDSQKFTGLLVLSYAFFAGLGLSNIIDYLGAKKPTSKGPFLAVIFIIPIIFGYLVWGGFHGQIRPVWYPDAWFNAKKIIDADKSESKVLFLPWHGYMSLRFNNNIISANPAKRFFGEKIIESKSVELGGIYNQEANEEYLILDAVIRDDQMDSDKKIDFLKREYGIKYIIKVKDLESVDNISYDFLFSPRMDKRQENDEALVYEIKR